MEIEWNVSVWALYNIGIDTISGPSYKFLALKYLSIMERFHCSKLSFWHLIEFQGCLSVSCEVNKHLMEFE